MRLWPLALIRKLRDRPAAHRILSIDPREQDLLDRLRDGRATRAAIEAEQEAELEDEPAE